jgi:hypothetical protein
MTKLFTNLFDLLGQDLWRVVEEVRVKGKVLNSFHSTFLAFIPKLEKMETFGYFRLLSF